MLDLVDAFGIPTQQSDIGPAWIVVPMRPDPNGDARGWSAQLTVRSRKLLLEPGNTSVENAERRLRNRSDEIDEPWACGESSDDA